MIAALVMAVVVGGDAPLANAEAEARAQSLMREIRCVVCENEPVSHSTADIAVDMRRTIRSQVSSGATDSEVRRFFSDRYGDFVLFRPPSDGIGMLLWIFPFGLLLSGLAAVVLRGRKAASRPLAPLSEDEVNARDR